MTAITVSNSTMVKARLEARRPMTDLQDSMGLSIP